MDIIMVSRSKLKVILSGDDLDHYGTKAESLDYSNCETRRVIEDILKKAKKDVGFDPVGDKMLVQLFPSRKGGCEIYVTKIEDEDIEEKHRPADNIRSALDNPVDKAKTLISFSSADAMLLFCRRALKFTNETESTAYIWNEPDRESPKRFFLSVIFPSGSEIQKLISMGIANEYGEIEEAEPFCGILPERALCVCESQAIQKLSKF